jgi:hypothetical protein
LEWRLEPLIGHSPVLRPQGLKPHSSLVVARRKKWNGSSGPFYMGKDGKMAADRCASNIRLKPNPLWNVRPSLKSSCGFSRRVGEHVAKLVRVSSSEGLTRLLQNIPENLNRGI